MLSLPEAELLDPPETMQAFALYVDDFSRKHDHSFLRVLSDQLGSNSGSEDGEDGKVDVKQARRDIAMAVKGVAEELAKEVTTPSGRKKINYHAFKISDKLLKVARMAREVVERSKKEEAEEEGGGSARGRGKGKVMEKHRGEVAVKKEPGRGNSDRVEKGFEKGVAVKKGPL